MRLLSPWALVWLGSVPVLLWLWRLSATHRQIRVPSLIPFEHLVKRQARRKTRLVVNALFWLQLAALIGLALALAQPLLPGRAAKVTLVILDTSASMDARLRGASGFDRAKQAVAQRIARKSPAEQLLVMTTAPVAALTPKPTSDAAALTQALYEARVSHLGGNLATAARIGRALLGRDPDETLVVTDEAQPDGTDDTQVPADERLRWISVGAPQPNIAIVGLDTRGAFCNPADAHVVATIHNFSSDAAQVKLAALQDGRRLMEADATVLPRERHPVSLALPEGVRGWVELALTAQPDALAVDNRAWVRLSQGDRLPVVIQAHAPLVEQTLSTWLGACQALASSAQAPPSGSYVLVTDDPSTRATPPWRGGLAQDSTPRAQPVELHEQLPPSAASGVLMVHPPADASPVLSYWRAVSDHPISAYVAPIEAVAASLNLSAGEEVAGVPVLSALIQGRSVPVVTAQEQDGRRFVSFWFDPSSSRDATPVLLAFFNSLRWLMSQADAQVTGAPLIIGGFSPGRVTIRRPDGSVDAVETGSGAVSYDATTLAGAYRLTQGPAAQTVHVNFFDPLESDTLERPSTWRALERSSPAQAPPPVPHPLANLLILLLIAVLLVEWWLYCAKKIS